MNCCVHYLTASCEVCRTLVRCIAGIPNNPLEVTSERSHMLMELLCSLRVGTFARPMSEPAEMLRQKGGSF